MVLLFLLFTAQQQPQPGVAEKTAADFAQISGIVLNDANGEPLRRARLTLASRIGGLAGTTFETNESGRFTFERIDPGQYGLQVTRDGFLPGVVARSGPFRLPRIIPLRAGESLKDVTFRLEPWAIVDGKVKFDDAEPALGVPVYLYQKVYFRGRQIYRIAAQTRTDDRGYYRMHGLTPGSYVLAAIYNKPIEKPKEDQPLKAPNREPSYASTYYPSGTRITGLPIRLTSGQELTGLDMFLEKFETVRVSGDLTDGCTGAAATGANLEVLRSDETGATIATNAEIRQTGGKFVIRGLGPGQYILQATLAPVRGKPGCPERTERYELTVAGEPVDSLKLLLVNDEFTRVRASTDDVTNSSFDLNRYPISLEPRTPGRAIVRPQRLDSRRLEFSASLNAREEFDVFLDRLPSEDMYLLPPYSISPGGTHEIRVGTRGARITGTVYDSQKRPVPGSVISIIPESYRPQMFREGYVNENGIFTIRGLAPGAYIAVGWLDVPPCELNVPRDRENCRAKGKSFAVKEGEQSLLELDLSTP